FKAYDMMFYDGTFYFPKPEHIPAVEQIIRFGAAFRQLPLTKNQADLFLSEVLPSLEDIGDVHISKHVKDAIVQLPLQAKLYLDLKESMIIGHLEYNYGSYTIDPFDGREENDVIIV